MNITPEAKAREFIDQWFDIAGWEVVDRDQITNDLQAIAVREGLMENNLEADYVLFLGGRAVGVLEAKRVEVDVLSPEVQQQALNYTHKAPSWVKVYENPLPIVYVSNGKDLYYLNQNAADYDPAEPQWQQVNRIFTPQETAHILQLQGAFVETPSLTNHEKNALRTCQREAIQNMESSFRAGTNRALVVIATGAGKTYTACMEAYRLLTYAHANRVLFLVDRNNLGKQAEEEFGRFKLTSNGDSFSNIYGVERMKSPQFGEDTNVVIATIQRLFSVLTGQNLPEDDDNEENEWDENDTASVTLPQKTYLNPDTFDLIIIDECHRSIYSKWRAVLDYFSSARMIGLTATPAPETMAFFDNNRVINYTLEQSIRDGVNVPCRIYSIDTLFSTQGGTIHKGDQVSETSRHTGYEQVKTQAQDETFKPEEINRRIVIPDQTRLILSHYKEVVYTQLFPQRAESDPKMRYIPKTLIFAVDDRHATQIVETLRDIFPNQDPRFVQKITYSAGDSNALIRSFRNDKEFRIAVTVTLVATGTDIKPLEVVMFMRDVSSELLYVQMKGRGVRTLSDDKLKVVTPNADTKSEFILIDAARVTKHAHTIPQPYENPGTQRLSLEQLLERLTLGTYFDLEAGGENLSIMQDLANRLARIYNRTPEEHLNEFEQLAHTPLKTIVDELFAALYPEEHGVIGEPDFRLILLPLTSNPAARAKLVEMSKGYIYTLTEPKDEIIFAGFSHEDAQATVSAFEQYITDHRDDMEALRIIYNNADIPLTYELLDGLRNQLINANSEFSILRLWNCYTILHPDDVRPLTLKQEREALTNIIALVRYAYTHISPLSSFYPTATQRFNLWCGQMQRSLTPDQQTIMRQVLDYVLANGACPMSDLRDFDMNLAARLIGSYNNNYDLAAEALVSMSSFILKSA